MNDPLLPWQEVVLGLVNYGISSQLLLAAKRRFGVETFVETGTFHGATTELAARHFERVYTVEFVKSRYLSTREKLKAYSNITFLNGNSAEVLRKVAKDLQNTSALYWLDAHWNGDGESRE